MSGTARSREQRRRLEERARARSEAAAVPVPDSVDVAVIGGGASGLVAAVAAARSGAGTVLVLESSEEVGLPILATGNGRCNLANVDLSPFHYNAPEFVGHVMGIHPLEAVLDLFGALGLAIEEEEAGRLYPRSRQAASVRNLLVDEARRLDVTLAPLREVTALGYGDDDMRPPLWTLRYLDRSRTQRTGTPSVPSELTVRARSIVLATGGGTVGLVESLRLPVVATRPANCGLACEPSPLDALDGRRVQALVRLEGRDPSEVPSSSGEVLFREGGLTGPPILDLSRFAEPGDRLLLDLVPDLSRDEVLAAMDRHLDERDRPTPIALDGLIDPVVGRTIVGLAHDGWPVPADSVAESAAALVKALPYTVRGRVAAHAQVTQGGIALDAVDPMTMAVTADDDGAPLPPGLFATGEVLDVDGPCGGYNLAFAWLSGLKAGRAAASLTSSTAQVRR